MFVYMTSDPKDIPNGNVYQYNWQGEDNNTDDDVIASEAELEKSPAKKAKKVKQRGRKAKGQNAKTNTSTNDTTDASPVSDTLLTCYNCFYICIITTLIAIHSLFMRTSRHR